jgi:hypothetical protein
MILRVNDSDKRNDKKRHLDVAAKSFLDGLPLVIKHSWYSGLTLELSGGAAVRLE